MRGPRLGLLLGLLALSACASSGTPTDEADRAGRKLAGAPAGPPTLAGPPGLPARVLAELPEGTELRVARRGTHGVLMLRQGGRWWTGAFDAVGDVTAPAGQDAKAPKEPESLVDIAPAPDDPALAALHPAGAGYLAAWLATTQGKQEVRAVALDERGRPTGQPVVVSPLADRARWIDVVPVGAKALVLVELERDGGRELHVVPWQERGGSRLVPAMRAVGGWQAAWHEEHAAIAAVLAPGGDALGQPVVTLLGADGTASAPVSLGAARTARSDVQAVVLRDRVLCAWTDVRAVPGLANDGPNDPHVWIAAVSFDGSLVVPPRPAVDPVGEHALAGLVATHDRNQALLAWESGSAPGAPRTIQLALLRADGTRAEQGAELSFEASGAWPQLAASEEGFAAITLASAALSEAAGGAAASPVGGVVPTVVRLGKTLDVLASEPVRVAELGEPGIPSLVRDLDCAGPSCSALAAQDVGESNAPPLVALVGLPARQSVWAPAARRSGGSGPRARGVGNLIAGEQRFIEVSAARLSGGGELGAWIGETASGTEGKEPTATIGYRLLSESAELGPPLVLSERAIAGGGIEVESVSAAAGAARGPRKPVATIGWVAPNNGAQQVFLTQIGADGKKLAQKTITQHRASKKGALEVTDVDLASDGAGNTVVAWTDNRDGNPEIYAIKMGPGLDKAAPEQRITQAEGSSTEVRIAVTPERIFLVWSDAREQAEQGSADIYLARLDPKTLKPLGPAQRLAETDTHSRTPGIAVVGTGLLVWWLEEPAGVGDASGSGLRVLRLDAKGEPLGSPLWLSAGQRTPITSATVGCAGNDCRAALAWMDGPALRLGALPLPGSDHSGARELRPALVPLLSLPGGNWQDVSLCATDGSLGSLWFVGPRAERATSVRRLLLGW